MSGVNSIMPRPSVPVNTGYVCNPAVISLQEFPTSGFYSRANVVVDVTSTRLGDSLNLRINPTVETEVSADCAESSLCSATARAINAISLYRALIPLGAACAAGSSRRLFYSEVTSI